MPMKKLLPIMLVVMAIAVIGEYTDIFDEKSKETTPTASVVETASVTEPAEYTETKAEADRKVDTSVVLTIDNCEDLAYILETKDPFDPQISKFAEEYKGCTIEFDAAIMFVNNHGDYKTRYDIMFFGGDYSETNICGPNFKFVDVGVHDLGVSDLYLPGYICPGQNVHIIATVEEFDSNTGLFELDPVGIADR